ncbi:ROK family transcriptional regulator [Dinoroseobacter sp. S375]|uniref:ROK family transcriptional regulator n=1 Tax=Dinoroseobacter sp. S375 TaxID=3415136 RepID=UPI003C7BFED1
MALIPPSPGANAPRSRSHNRHVILGQIQAAGPMGRAALARSTGLSTQAVSNIIADLETDGLLEPCGARTVGRGLPAMQYQINPGGAFALGIEVRQTAIVGALLDLGGAIQATERVSLTDTAPETILPLVKSLKQRLLASCPQAQHKLLGAGLVMPGPFGATGLSGASADLTGWTDINVQEAFETALDGPVFVQNDANAAAMAERLGGLAQGVQTFGYLYFGSGLGLGLVAHGQLITGAFGNAGELGQIPVMTPDGPRTLENCASRNAVQSHLARAGLPGDDIEQLARHFADGQPALLGWIDGAAAALSQVLPLLENLFDPETILLGGAMPAEIVEAMVARITLPEVSVAHRPDRQYPRLQVGSCGRLTATRGAAALVLSNALSPQFSLSA